MVIRESQSSSLPLGTHRTRPEQLVGLGIYLSISLGCELVSKISAHFLGTIYSIFLALGMWFLWRSYSLRVLKLELSVFLAQYLFQIVWSLSFFLFQQSLLSLVALLLLWCNTLLATLLFWKKDRFSGMLYLFPLVWTFYLALANMSACIYRSWGE